MKKVYLVNDKIIILKGEMKNEKISIQKIGNLSLMAMEEADGDAETFLVVVVFGDA